MSTLIEISPDQAEEVVVGSLLWMYYNGELTKKEKKAYRTVLSHYIVTESYAERFGDKEVYK